ncbi:MAG: ParB N-terminal domain-containing protein [Deltaproteobacteria bacterium]|nr:ParB N-terminal domain-containing protein [Deltaproteobacteria bacterium]
MIDPATIATRLGASIVELATPGKIRFTLIGPKTDAAASVFVERSHAELLRMPEDERILEILAEWFERGWNSSHPIPGQSFSVHEIDVAHVFSALRTGVVQYKNAKIHLEEVIIESLRPATHALETFKLFRINQFVALRQRYNLPDFARLEGLPWPLIGPPVVERLPDGAMVIIDGTHRVYSARARGAVSIPAIVVENPNFDLPSQPASGWDHVEILAHKLPRERRYKKFNPSLFRPIRAAFESLDV